MTRLRTHVPAAPYVGPTTDSPGVLRLDGNEGPLPPRELVESLSTLEPESIRAYPSTRDLGELLASRLGAAPDRIVVTAGADDALDRALRAYAQDRELVLPIPTFEMIHRFATVAGAKPVTVRWEGVFPTADVLRAITPDTGAIVIVTPNNPTGLVACRGDVRRIAEAAPEALVLVDHTYADYADEDLTELGLELENIAVVRTFSKAWGLAGCRVGYAVASPAVAAVLRNAGNPYPVATPSLAVVTRALQSGGGSIEAHVARVREERDELARDLRARGFSVSRSQGNFVFVDFGARADFVQQGLAVQRVSVRRFPHRPEIATGIRITMPGHPESFVALRAALDLCLDPEALLFDLDGVLADERQSYRRCIALTARDFGCEVSSDDVERAKLELGASNDWQVTRELLRSRGREVSHSAVIERFQSHYLGAGDVPSLAERERPLVSAAWLKRLSRRVPIGVVTARPRDEAVSFLERAGFLPLIGALVCMEDAPSKPSPVPVSRALEQLGARRAWLLGDSPDDIRAAGAAGVLPLGVIAPGARRDRATEALRQAGAVAVLTSPEKIEELLS